jgi:hypothetical protein
MLQKDFKSGLSLIVCLMLALVKQCVLSRQAYTAISRPALAILGDIANLAVGTCFHSQTTKMKQTCSL